MEPAYEPQEVEERWQRTWEEEGLYAAEPDPEVITSAASGK